MSRRRTDDELLAASVRLRQELDEVDAEIRARRIGKYRPLCPNKGTGPDGKERWCANQIRHEGRCEFIYLLGVYPYDGSGTGVR